VNQWIIQKTATMIDDVAREIEAYRFDFAAGALYHFLWGAYCDIYVECLKPLLTDTAIADETRKTAMWVLVQFLKAANPIMPILTEHLWEEFGGQDTLMEQPWETITAPSSEAIQGVDWAVAFIQEVRSLKGLLGITGVVRVPLVSQGSAADNALLTKHWPWISHLARLSDLKMTGNGVPFVVAGSTFVLEINDAIRLDDVTKMLQDKLAVLSNEVAHLSKKLANEAFKTAKPDVWQTDFDLHGVKSVEVEKIQGILESL
jgi:valyl-tRNA synthetase